MEVRVDQKFLETCATGTLLGTVFKMSESSGGLPGEVVLVFPQTSLAWRRENGGPDELIVNEFVIPCLVEDVMALLSRGVKVSVRMEEVC